MIEAFAKLALRAKFDDFDVGSFFRKLTYPTGHRRFAKNSNPTLKAQIWLQMEFCKSLDKVMQDFESKSLLLGGDHSQKVKAPPIKSDYDSKNCVNLSSLTAVFRFKGL
jgi:hypothetical protein